MYAFEMEKKTAFATLISLYTTTGTIKRCNFEMSAAFASENCEAILLIHHSNTIVGFTKVFDKYYLLLGSRVHRALKILRSGQLTYEEFQLLMSSLNMNNSFWMSCLGEINSYGVKAAFSHTFNIPHENYHHSNLVSKQDVEKNGFNELYDWYMSIARMAQNTICNILRELKLDMNVIHLSENTIDFCVMQSVGKMYTSCYKQVDHYTDKYFVIRAVCEYLYSIIPVVSIILQRSGELMRTQQE